MTRLPDALLDLAGFLIAMTLLCALAYGMMQVLV